MKNSFLILLCLAFTWQTKAQAPQYSHYIAPTDTNIVNMSAIDFPIHTNAILNTLQGIYTSNDFPGMPQHGQITAVYLRLQSLGKGAQIDSVITIKITVKIKAFPNDSFIINQQPETGLTTVFFDSSYQFTNDSTTAAYPNMSFKWLKLPLANPYTYSFDDNEDRKGNLLVEITGEVIPYRIYAPNINSFISNIIHLNGIVDTNLNAINPKIRSIAYSSNSSQSYKQYWYGRVFIGFDAQPLASVSEVRNGAASAVYPNPVKERLYFQSSLQGATFTLYNLSGIKVMSGKASASGVSVSSLPKGMYLLQAEGKMWKVVKE